MVLKLVWDDDLKWWCAAGTALAVEELLLAGGGEKVRNDGSSLFIVGRRHSRLDKVAEAFINLVPKKR